MHEKAQQIKLLTRILYLFISLLVVFTAVNIGLLMNYHDGPKTIYLKSPETSNKAANEVSAWHVKSLSEIPTGKAGELIQYGYELISNTPNNIGPMAKEASLRFAGNNLACTNCHLDGGRKIGAGSFVGVSNRFPQFRGRENKTGSLADRINGCLERSMNGRTMPEETKEMQSMIAYMNWLSDGVPKNMEQKYKGFISLSLPNEAANPSIGKKLYTLKCAVCHQANGEGTPKGEGLLGYTYPPLSGKDSYNDGAGMHRVITAAQFLKANMPLGASYDAPQLTDAESFHLAAYINTLSRPEKMNKQADFPDRKLKPVSTPYGPWKDNFTAEQHKFGPFQPIIDYYEKTYQLVKTK